MIKANPVIVVDTNALFISMQNARRYMQSKYVGPRDSSIERSADEYAPYRLFMLLSFKEIILATSPAIIAEVSRLLARHSGDRLSEVRDEFFRLLQKIINDAILVDPPKTISICRDPDDDRVIECAVIAKAEYIITEDLDLLSLRNYENIRIMNMLTFVKHFEDRQS